MIARRQDGRGYGDSRIASSIRRRFGAFWRVSDLIIANSLFVDRPGPLRRDDADDSAV